MPARQPRLVIALSSRQPGATARLSANARPTAPATTSAAASSLASPTVPVARMPKSESVWGPAAIADSAATPPAPTNTASTRTASVLVRSTVKTIGTRAKFSA